MEQFVRQLMGEGGLVEEAQQARQFWNSDAAISDRMERILKVRSGLRPVE